ncbi:MAG TPA: hypothetical protein VLG16_02390 [Candidatus Saccharimonadales bacterium]|nr:hypothetical protein [Candidatus Saccharimonadales bacterium]
MEPSPFTANKNLPPQPENTAIAEQAFSYCLTDLANQLLELQPELEDIEKSGHELIQRHNLVGMPFNKAQTVFFAGIAQRLLLLRRSDTPDNASQYQAEMCFIDDAVTMLEVSSLEDSNDETERAREIYDRYTDRDLTERVKAFIDGDFFDPVKHNLPPDHQEIPYDLHVLDIGFDIDHPAWDFYDFDDAEKRRLADQAQRFDSETQKFASLCPAWAEPVGDKYILAINNPLALKMLADPASDEAMVVLHEFAHAQTCEFNLDLIGGTVEERAADVIAGTEHYPDIERFMDVDLYIVTGHSLTALIRKFAGHKDPDNFWAATAEKFGLQQTLELGLATTGTFIEANNNPTQTRIHNHIGGLDGIIRRAYYKNCQDPARKMEMDKRMMPHTQWLANLIVVEPNIYEAYKQYYGDEGMHFMLDLLAERALEQIARGV